MLGNLQASSDYASGAYMRVSNLDPAGMASQTAVGFVPVYQAGHNNLIPLLVNADLASREAPTN